MSDCPIAWSQPELVKKLQQQETARANQLYASFVALEKTSHTASDAARVAALSLSAAISLTDADLDAQDSHSPRPDLKPNKSRDPGSDRNPVSERDPDPDPDADAALDDDDAQEFVAVSSDAGAVSAMCAPPPLQPRPLGTPTAPSWHSNRALLAPPNPTPQLRAQVAPLALAQGSPPRGHVAARQAAAGHALAAAALRAHGPSSVACDAAVPSVPHHVHFP
eukprot:7053177-Prymnesium_polylepis.2